MNAEERRAVEDFLQEMSRARVQHKDHEAERLIGDAFARHPDAAYLVVQRTLLQEQALDSAQREIAVLRQELEAARQLQSDRYRDSSTQWGRSGSFLSPYPQRHGSDLGYRQRETAWSRPGLMSGGMGSFLGSMAGVAAGAMAGSFLYHGIDDLLHQDRGEGAAAQGLGDSPEMPGPLADDAGTGNIARDAGIDDIGWGGDDIGGEDYG